MSRVQMILLVLMLVTLALATDVVYCNPPIPYPQQPPPLPPPKPNPEYVVEKVKIPSWDSLSINSGNMSVIGKTSELSKTILITKITPSIGEIILNNKNNTMPVNVSGWHLGILSINHPDKEVIANGSVISPMGQLVVRTSYFVTR